MTPGFPRRPDRRSRIRKTRSSSAWEITTKHRLGRLPEAGDVAARLPHYLRRARLSVLGISLEHAMAAGALPGPHKDPFDRMLVAGPH
jgi:PIN domain nuclease of toxin-antitoxin system